MVKIIYGEPYKSDLGIEKEELDVLNLKELFEILDFKYADYGSLFKKSIVIITNKRKIVSSDNLDYKLEKEDEILLKMHLSGG